MNNPTKTPPQSTSQTDRDKVAVCKVGAVTLPLSLVFFIVMRLTARGQLTILELRLIVAPMWVFAACGVFRFFPRRSKVKTQPSRFVRPIEESDARNQ